MDRSWTKERLLREVSLLRRQLEGMQLKAAAPLAVRPSGNIPPSAGGLTGWEQVNDVLRDKAELFDLAHDSIIVRDLEGRILFWNRGAELHYGWRKEEAVGRLSHILLQTQFPMAVEEIFQELSVRSWWEGELVHTIALWRPDRRSQPMDAVPG